MIIMDMEKAYDRAQLKRDAKESMRLHRPSVYPVAFLLIVLFTILEILSLKLDYPGVTLREIIMSAYDAEIGAKVVMSAFNRGLLPALLGLAVAMMSTIISAGYSAYCLTVSRGLKAGVGEIFDVFGIFFKVLWLLILTGLFTFLWSLLLIIPGIIASYRYSLALYILLDDPDKSALQCIDESKKMMCGWKGSLFVMDLSFLGWILLSVIPFVSIYTMPYMEIARANFYRFVSGKTEAPASAFYWENHGRDDGNGTAGPAV